ncbi:hypothetical protein XENTR_v10022545 [Xenopus tropicalis]|nr:hypothetical protein XENTR_v10022545 [Xenopus tropicalis]
MRSDTHRDTVSVPGCISLFVAFHASAHLFSLPYTVDVDDNDFGFIYQDSNSFLGDFLHFLFNFPTEMQTFLDRVSQCTE